MHPTIDNIRLFDDRSPFTLRLRLRRSRHGHPARAYCPRFRTGQHPGSRPLSRLAGLKLGGAVQSSQEFHAGLYDRAWRSGKTRSEEHTSELQSLMRISYAVFCLKKKNTKK